VRYDTPMRSRIGVLLFVTSALSACTSSSSSLPERTPQPSEPRACNPFETGVADLALGDIVAIGRAPDGTLYVVDKVGFEHRVFVSAGGVLQRKRVLGSGETPEHLTLSCSDEQGALQVKIELSAGKPARMGILRGELTDAKTFDIDAGGEALELVDAGAATGMPVRDLPKGQIVLYDASTSDGHRVVATSPTHDARYEDYRLFYGVPTDMIERNVRDAIGGGTLFMTFDLDGTWATANFPSQFSGPPNDVAKIRFEDGRPQLSMTILDANADPPTSALAYRCR
jgi:hypothetical protein